MLFETITMGRVTLLGLTLLIKVKYPMVVVRFAVGIRLIATVS